MNKTGFQFQIIGEAQRTLLRATWPWCLKMLQTGKSLDLAKEWRAHVPNGVLVLRYVTGDSEPLSDLPRLTDLAIKQYEGFQSVGGKVVLEVPINERFQTTKEDFAALAEASVTSARTIKAAGFTPGVLITSEGNPPGPDFGIAFFLQPAVLDALREFRKMGAIWCPHGYSHPPAISDDAYHSIRPQEILAQLPEDVRLNYLYGEDGCDGGCDLPNKKPGVGWMGYFPNARAYAEWMHAKRQAITDDPLCVGSAMFLSGGYSQWQTFDIGDEVGIRPYFTEAVDGPPIHWLDGGGNVTELLDRTWALAEEWERAAYPWMGQGIKALCALLKGEK